MVRKLVSVVAVALVSALPLTAAATEEVPIRVVVHADNPVAELPAREVSRVFKKQVPQWDDGAPVVPVDRNVDAGVREVFSRAVHDRSAGAMASYWKRMVFSDGSATPPLQLSSDEAVLAYVAEHRGAVGYVSARTPLVPGVRTLRISDVRTASDPPEDRAATTVVAERGDVRILLTGSCGPDGEGREAILLHRHHQATVRVTIETSHWHDGRLESSHRHHHTLNGHQEKRLGCTRDSPGLERRYAIARISSNAVHAEPRLDDLRPPRDFIAFVETGVCGRGGEGRRIAVVNRHPYREIRVVVERVQKLHGDFKSRSRKSYRLATGGEKELGCSRDGGLELELFLAEVE